MLYKRKILKDIKKWLSLKEFIILRGPRQVGKTSILQLIQKELLKKKIPKDNIFYLNLEDLHILDFLNQSPENILDYITDKKEKNYFLLDEIQYLDNPSNFLKHIFDKYSDKIKIICTGSSNLELKAKFQDSLAGRKISFMINPLDFEEFLYFQKFPFLKYLRQEKIPQDIRYQFDKKLEEYLIYGGMPAVVLHKKKEEKEKLLNEYVGDYVNKDVRAIGKIDSIFDFNNLLKTIASQIGSLLNINELTNTLDIDRRKIKKYLEILKATYVLNELRSYHSNIRSQITKMPKFYFFDLGIRNAILGNFLPLSGRNCQGFLFENFVFLELKNLFNNIYFYRTSNKTEIDFIVLDKGELFLYEVKFKNLKKAINTKVIEYFMNSIDNVRGACVVNKSLVMRGEEARINYCDYRGIIAKYY